MLSTRFTWTAQRNFRRTTGAFFALLFNHFPRVAREECFLLFVSRSSAGATWSPLAIAPAERLQVNCSNASSLREAQLSDLFFSLSMQVRSAYVPPADCNGTSATASGAVASSWSGVAPWLHGVLAPRYPDPSGSDAGNMTIRAYTLTYVSWGIDPRERVAVSEASHRCISSAVTVPVSSLGVPAQTLGVAPNLCLTFARNVSGAADAVDMLTSFQGQGEAGPPSCCLCRIEDELCWRLPVLCIELLVARVSATPCPLHRSQEPHPALPITGVLPMQTAPVPAFRLQSTHQAFSDTCRRCRRYHPGHPTLHPGRPPWRQAYQQQRRQRQVRRRPHRRPRKRRRPRRRPAPRLFRADSQVDRRVPML